MKIATEAGLTRYYGSRSQAEVYVNHYNNYYKNQGTPWHNVWPNMPDPRLYLDSKVAEKEKPKVEVEEKPFAIAPYEKFSIKKHKTIEDYLKLYFDPKKDVVQVHAQYQQSISHHKTSEPGYSRRGMMNSTVTGYPSCCGFSIWHAFSSHEQYGEHGMALKDLTDDQIKAYNCAQKYMLWKNLCSGTKNFAGIFVSDHRAVRDLSEWQGLRFGVLLFYASEFCDVTITTATNNGQHGAHRWLQQVHLIKKDTFNAYWN